MADLDRLRRLLGGEETVWLLDRLRRRMANGKPLSGTVTLGSATQDQRRAIERLLGRRASTGTSLSVSLDEVDATLRRSGAAPDGLADATRLLIGTVPDRLAEAAAWASIFEPLDELVERRPALATWRTWLDSTGLIRRSAPEPEAASALISMAMRVLAELPSKGVALGRLAAQTTGDAHGLDDGRPLATLVLSAARVLSGTTPAGTGTAAERRASWAAVGVHLDELSSSVLCLGLPGGVETTTGRILALAKETGEPCVLTLRQLALAELEAGGQIVSVCENPIVLASAADELGSRCPPLVCLNGQPSAAVWRLLDLLTAVGARFRYHGDFDWGGIRIGNTLRGRVAWRPWRFDTNAYAGATATGGELTGKPAEASWDTGLRTAMELRGLRIEEELMLPALLDDLRTLAD
ncbi:TIGR02679 family protein [Amycolatopsis thailandensis]|uniref:TIGR02679 family protein n=1 Tax=Amycolatopsis thailandensis TaxID=589330 RepID=UPI003646E066